MPFQYQAIFFLRIHVENFDTCLKFRRNAFLHTRNILECNTFMKLNNVNLSAVLLLSKTNAIISEQI